jgi:photoactive yellow protein
MTLLPQSLIDQLPSMDRAALDALEVGVVGVDDKGIVLVYNLAESRLSGVAPSAAEGRNFFTQVAPCTNNRLLYGRFKEGVAQDRLALIVPYTFTYKMKPTNVTVQLARTQRTNWILIARR